MTSRGARIAVLMGGPSAEHDVSMNSGAQVMEALAGEAPLPVVITKTGTWWIDGEAQPSAGAALDRLAAEAEVVFIALHGPFGEDGTIQGMLEGFGITYTGSGVAASALAMDKIRTKLIYEARGLPTSPFEILTPKALDDADGGRGRMETAGARIGYPAVVKQSRNGSSFGVSFAKDAEALVATVRGLLEEGSEVLVERFVRGREVTCGVLAIDAEKKVFPLPVTEIIPGEAHAFFDYVAKYTPGATREVTPAEIPEALAEKVQRMALEAHLSLGCRDFSRTDFMVDEAGRPFLLETNTIPGLTKTSLLPQAAAAAGIPFPALIRHLIDDARRRKPRR